MEEKMEQESYQEPVQEQPVQAEASAPAPEPAPTTPESVDAPTQETTNQPTPEVEVEAPTTQEPVAQEPTQATDEVELDTLPNYGQAPELQPFDWTQLPQEADGSIDPNAFAAAINQQITQATEVARQQARVEAQEQIKEQKLWEQAENAYPELKQDKELRDMVKNARWGEWVATNGTKNPSPKAIADKIFNKIGQAQKQGVEQAQNNVRIQESAALETASNTATASPQTELRTRVASANTREQKDTATTELLKTLIDSGDIKIGE